MRVMTALFRLISPMVASISVMVPANGALKVAALLRCGLVRLVLPARQRWLGAKPHTGLSGGVGTVCLSERERGSAAAMAFLLYV